MNFRYHGLPPYTAVAVHGGPGAQGSVWGLAQGLADCCGVLEPMQTKDTIDGLIEELAEQIKHYAAVPVVLIGHSWGAWLAGLTAAHYPELVRKVILVGSGPLTDTYVPEMDQRRMMNLSLPEQKEFQRLKHALETPDASSKPDQIMPQFGALANKADYYSRSEPCHKGKQMPPDGKQYAVLWPQAAALRSSGELLSRFLKISSPLIVIQGKQDPHPAHGVTRPLAESGFPLKSYLLDCCGHTPWEETFAKGKFFRILKDELESAPSPPDPTHKNV